MQSALLADGSGGGGVMFVVRQAPGRQAAAGQTRGEAADFCYLLLCVNRLGFFLHVVVDGEQRLNVNVVAPRRIGSLREMDALPYGTGGGGGCYRGGGGSGQATYRSIDYTHVQPTTHQGGKTGRFKEPSV